MKKMILVIDDSASMRQLVSFTLEDAGNRVITAENGKDAIDTIDKLDGLSLSMVITDLNMPIMNGFDFIKELRSREEFRCLPVIMLTTESQELKHREGEQVGVDYWLVKPFTPQQLLGIVEKYINNGSHLVGKVRHGC